MPGLQTSTRTTSACSSYTIDYSNTTQRHRATKRRKKRCTTRMKWQKLHYTSAASTRLTYNYSKYTQKRYCQHMPYLLLRQFEWIHPERLAHDTH